ncbi:MAG: hypothetical protein M3Y31_02425 [Gemmatimonadota bacterium]|nr:hypothetical protein [Gemmatimonadota bacterium]
MIGRLRRWRLLGLLLLLATPGFAGTALEGLHPCPESAPWVAAASEASHAGHGAGGEHDASGHTGDCHCLGACLAAIAALPLAPELPGVAVDRPVLAGIPVAPADLPASRPSDRLPPATAPPLI